MASAEQLCCTHLCPLGTCSRDRAEKRELRWSLVQCQTQARTRMRVRHFRRTNAVSYDVRRCLDTFYCSDGFWTSSAFQDEKRNDYLPPFLTRVPSAGSSTKTTSPNESCAWSVIVIVPSPVVSSKVTVSCSSVYRCAAMNGVPRCERQGKKKTDWSNFEVS